MSREFEGFASWWHQFAAHEVKSVDAIDSFDAYRAATRVAEALNLWHKGGAAAGDVAFWAPHAEMFDSSRAYALVIEALLEKNDYVASLERAGATVRVLDGTTDATAAAFAGTYAPALVGPGETHVLTIRVAIARSIVVEPRVILADEPTANLDSRTGSSIIRLMKHINRRYGTTFVFSTHDKKVIAKAELEKTQALMKQLGSNPLMKSMMKGGNVDVDLESELSKISVKKLACAKAEGNPGYNCDVEMSRPGEGSAGPQKSPMKGRFVKSDDGWVMMVGPLGR